MASAAPAAPASFESPAALRDYMFSLKHWGVAGGVTDSSKPAYRIVNHLKSHGHTVSLINPNYFPPAGESPNSSVLSSLPASIEVLDLCINSLSGLELLQKAPEIGLKYVFIQPGAGSEEILEYTKKHNIFTYSGCVLVEMKSKL